MEVCNTKKYVNVDGLTAVRRRLPPPPVLEVRPVQLKLELKTSKQPGWNFVVAGVVVSAFLFGSYITWSAPFLAAEEPISASKEQVPPGVKVLQVTANQLGGSSAQVPDSVFFSLTLDQLENFLDEKFKTDDVKLAEELAVRKDQLKAYLEEKSSPLAEIADTLAELKHWKMVLAISNSESSLGKRCYTNNCSGIGVEPGHPLWREYPSKKEWARDLDKLLEKRYKDWTLEEMNGVYNQPGSANWLSASRQILEELQEKGID